jgi:hypothetical protein
MGPFEFRPARVIAVSKLESFIRRMQAQVICLDTAASMIPGVPGVVWEIGLGNGRSFDHLRERFPDREIFVFDLAVNAHPDCVPDDRHMILGDIRDTLPDAAQRFAGRVVLVHCDVGSGDTIENQRLARCIGREIAPALCDGAVVIADRDLHADWLACLPLPADVYPGRYFMYQHRGGQVNRHPSFSAA